MKTLAHQIQELRQKIDAQQKDFAYRLCMLSAQQLGADASDQGLNCGAVGTAPAANNGGIPPDHAPGTPLPPIGSDSQSFNGPPSTGAPQQLGRPPGTLGTLPMNSGPMNTGPANGGSTSAALRPTTAAPSAGQFDARHESAGQGAI